VFQGLFGLYRVVAYEHIFPSCFLPVLGFLPVAMLLKKGLNRKRWTVLVCTIFFIEAGQMFWYYQNISYTLHHAIQDIKLKIRPASRDIVFAGDSALLLAFELKTRAIDVMYRQDRLHALIKRMQPDYIFLENPRELDRIQQQVSGYFDNIKPIGRYRIMNNYHHGQDAVLYCVVKKR
jgi:hypothetical protein